MKNNNIDKYIFKKDLFDISPSSNSSFQHILHRVPRIRSSFDSRDHPFRSSLDERRTQLPSNQEYEFSSKLVRTKSKTSSISIGSFLFLFLFSTLSSPSSLFTSSVLFHRGSATLIKAVKGLLTVTGIPIMKIPLPRSRESFWSRRLDEPIPRSSHREPGHHLVSFPPFCFHVAARKKSVSLTKYYPRSSSLPPSFLDSNVIFWSSFRKDRGNLFHRSNSEMQVIRIIVAIVFLKKIIFFNCTWIYKK